MLCPSQCIPFFYWWTLRRIERWDEFNTHLFPHPTCKRCSWCWTTLCPPFDPLLSEAQGADLPHVACQGAPYQGSSPLSLRLTCISRTQDTKSWLPLNSCHCPLFFSFWLLVFTSHLMIWLLHSDRSPETCLKIDGASESCDFPPKRTSTTHPPQNSVHTQITLFQLGTELLILQVGFQVCEGCSVHGFLWFTEQSSRDCNENLGCWSSGSRTVQCLT